MPSFARTLWRSRLIRVVLFLTAGIVLAVVGPILFAPAPELCAWPPEYVIHFDMRSFVTQLRTFKAMNGRFPTTEEGLASLVTRPASMESLKRWRPLFSELPPDPWGSDYQYAYPSSKGDYEFDVYSFGADGVPSEDDVYNKIN